jgi:hypothetical protein
MSKEGKYMSKEDEVFKASIQMSLLFETNNLLKMGMIYVRIDPKQPLEYCLYHIPEVHWERSTCSKNQRDILIMLQTSIDSTFNAQRMKSMLPCGSKTDLQSILTSFKHNSTFCLAHMLKVLSRNSGPSSLQI